MVGLSNKHPLFFVCLRTKKNLMLILFLIIAVINVAVILLTGILISHKVAGPLYRLRTFLENKDILNAERVKFRKGDYFLDIENSLNSFIERSQEKVGNSNKTKEES